ncbi:MAG: hypothetical protein IBJ10_02265 [Phycisphaerales bacterium]|nr:hypothetical protein [Phycisphaerales bacterium]
MATPGALVVLAGGARSILPGGGAALYNAKGRCPNCCPPIDSCDECPCCEGPTLVSTPGHLNSGSNTLSLEWSYHYIETFYNTTTGDVTSQNQRQGSGTTTLTGSGTNRCYSFTGSDTVNLSNLSGPSGSATISFSLRTDVGVTVSGTSGSWTALFVTEPTGVRFTQFHARPSGETWWRADYQAPNGPFSPTNAAGSTSTNEWDNSASVTHLGGAVIEGSFSGSHTVRAGNGNLSVVRTLEVSARVTTALYPCV